MFQNDFVVAWTPDDEKAQMKVRAQKTLRALTHLCFPQELMKLGNSSFLVFQQGEQSLLHAFPKICEKD
jgi:hypothetical protein